jgi:hypothetical protein
MIYTDAGFRNPEWMASDSMVRGGEHFVPRPCWYFTFLHAGRLTGNFWEVYPVKKRKIVSREGSNLYP